MGALSLKQVCSLAYEKGDVLDRHLKTRLQLSTAGFTYMALVFKDKAAQHPLPSFTYRPPPLLWEARCLFALTAISEME